MDPALCDAVLVNAVFFHARTDILRNHFKRGRAVSHGDAKSYGFQHQPVIVPVAKGSRLFSGQTVMIERLLDADAFPPLAGMMSIARSHHAITLAFFVFFIMESYSSLRPPVMI